MILILQPRLTGKNMPVVTFMQNNITPAHRIENVMLYQASYWASLLRQKKQTKHTYGAGYVRKKLKCVSLQFILYGK